MILLFRHYQVVTAQQLAILLAVAVVMGSSYTVYSITKENLKQEHVCYVTSNNKDCQVTAKKSCLTERFADGLVFKKMRCEGKIFFEYVLAEKAWRPIEAEDYLYVQSP